MVVSKDLYGQLLQVSDIPNYARFSSCPGDFPTLVQILKQYQLLSDDLRIIDPLLLLTILNSVQKK